MAAVSGLVSALDGELVRLGYKPSTLKWYRGCWRRLERYFASRCVREFSLDVAMAWVDEACGGFFEKEQAGTLKATDVYLFRVAAMLDDFAAHRAVLRRYSRSVSKLSAEQADVLAGFQAWLRAGGCAVSTVRAYGTVVGEFLAFAASRGGLAGLDGAVIGAFVQTLAGYAPKTVEYELCAVRSLLRFAADGGLIDRAVLDTVPAVKSSRQARVPSVWDPADVAKILEAIDRGNPSGKRDYAIVLLICRLGLRAVDVKRLRFADLDWRGNRLSVVQAKTGRRVDLPLLKDVGWAIIDYVRDGRPGSDCPQVFVRHTAPIGPFSDQDHLHQILVKHARVARVSLSEERQSRDALAQAHVGDEVDGGRHAGRADRRHSRPPVRRVDRRLSEVVSRPIGQVRPGSGPARARGGGPVSAEITVADAIAELVAEKRGLGYKYVSEERALARFEVFCASAFPGLETVTRASVEAWIAAARGRAVKPATVNNLIAPVRELARWLHRRGVEAYVLPAGVLEKPVRYVPHIYSDRELAALFEQTDHCRYCPEVPFRHLVMPVLFRTIYACGLRCSEARLLRARDVDIDAGVLQIRDAKGGKDRQLPVSEPLRERLAGYHSKLAGQSGWEWFFPGATLDVPVTLNNVNRNFRRFLWQARIPHRGRGHGPRVHDLRHAMAVNNLRSWFAQGENVDALLPVLQTYLGHSSIGDTAYYLRLTAASYPDITARVEQTLGDVVPPLTGAVDHGD